MANLLPLSNSHWICQTATLQWMVLGSSEHGGCEGAPRSESYIHCSGLMKKHHWELVKQ
jgi:hypothetical protein